MCNFSGLFYRIYGVCGVIFMLGTICLILEKPWKGLRKGSVLGIILIIMSILLCALYVWRIISPDISSYTGELIEVNRNSRVAPPLPFTKEYIFYNGFGKRKVMYLDTGSKNTVLGGDIEIGKTYTVYFDDFTKIIVGIEMESQS